MKKLIHELVAYTGGMYARNDRAHQIGHVASVGKLATTLNRDLGLGLDDRLLLIAAYMHDIFNRCRDHHHDIAADYVLGMWKHIPGNLTVEEARTVADAVREHRASYKGEFSSLYSEVISAADRGRPTTANVLLERSILYGIDRLGLTQEAALCAAIQNTKEKYGTNGYVNYPPLYRRMFAFEIERLQKEVDAL